MDEQFRAFLAYWGNRFVIRLKEELSKSYPYAPGIDGNAYGQGRNAEYSGQAPKIATGNLLNSISSVVVDEGVELWMNSYWEFVNYGRAAGNYVPITPLENWARLKGFDNPRGAAFGISKNIQKFGIAPTNFYENAITALQMEFDEDLTFQFGQSLDDFFNSVLTPNV